MGGAKAKTARREAGPSGGPKREWHACRQFRRAGPGGEAELLRAMNGEIGRLARAQRLGDAQAVFRQISGLGLRPNLFSYSALLNAYARCGEPGRAEKLYGILRGARGGGGNGAGGGGEAGGGGASARTRPCGRGPAAGGGSDFAVSLLLPRFKAISPADAAVLLATAVKAQSNAMRGEAAFGLFLHLFDLAAEAGGAALALRRSLPGPTVLRCVNALLRGCVRTGDFRCAWLLFAAAAAKPRRLRRRPGPRPRPDQLVSPPPPPLPLDAAAVAAIVKVLANALLVKPARKVVRWAEKCFAAITAAGGEGGRAGGGAGGSPGGGAGSVAGDNFSEKSHHLCSRRAADGSAADGFAAADAFAAAAAPAYVYTLTPAPYLSVALAYTRLRRRAKALKWLARAEAANGAADAAGGGGATLYGAHLRAEWSADCARVAAFWAAPAGGGAAAAGRPAEPSVFHREAPGATVPPHRLRAVCESHFPQAVRLYGKFCGEGGGGGLEAFGRAKEEAGGFFAHHAQEVGRKGWKSELEATECKSPSAPKILECKAPSASKGLEGPERGAPAALEVTLAPAALEATLAPAALEATLAPGALEATLTPPAPPALKAPLPPPAAAAPFLEICSGTGDWVVAQAAAAASPGETWYASELRQDRAHGVLARALMARVSPSRLRILSGDVLQFLADDGFHASHAAAFGAVYVNFPEPPPFPDHPAHLLGPRFFNALRGCLRPRAHVYVVSDNLPYLHVVAALVPAVGYKIRTGTVVPGFPTPERYKNASSYFDRLWGRGGKTERGHLDLIAS